MPDEDRESVLLCPLCGEENPRTFRACWSCQGELAGAALGRSTPTQPAPPEAGPPRVVEMEPARRQRLLVELGVLMLLIWVPSIASGVFHALARTSPMGPSRVGFYILSNCGTLALLVYLASLDGSCRRRLGLQRPRIVRELLWGCGVFCGMWLCGFLGVLVAHKTGLEFPGARGPRYEPELDWILAVSTLSAVLVEEVFYRAYLWSRLTELSRRPTLSLAVAGLGWVSTHFYTLNGSVGLLLSGWLLGWLFMERRSLWALVLGHWAYNLSLHYHWFG